MLLFTRLFGNKKTQMAAKMIYVKDQNWLTKGFGDEQGGIFCKSQFRAGAAILQGSQTSGSGQDAKWPEHEHSL